MYRILIIIFVFLSVTYSKESDPTDKLSPSLISEIINFEIQSVNVGDKFVINVSLPESYSTTTETKYPVLYITDGYWRKEQHQPIHDMSRNENVKEMIIVGISYPDGYDANNIRVRDLITGADKFLDFICKELIPSIDSKYRTTTERTLWGSSYGGYFGMYALFNYTEKTKGVFKNYIIASAAALEKTNYNGIPLDLFGYERLQFSSTDELNLNLYITVGGIEDVNRFLDPFKNLVAILQSRAYKLFFMKSYIDPGKNHFTVWEPTLYEGIRLFMKKD